MKKQDKQPEVAPVFIPDETAIAEQRLRDGEAKLKRIQEEMRSPRTEITSRAQGVGASVNEISQHVFTELDATLKRLGITEDDLKVARDRVAATEQANLEKRFNLFKGRT
jgi:hypothetical protein